ncbi:MAG: serine/threonine protein kinase [Planctomycetaceae bacterium]|nr:serine/threonine protein kinase [Planctomycetota bacterium]NUN52791.1 serine/threonine protein kinase [Planctomycetaceae bacterium]
MFPGKAGPGEEAAEEEEGEEEHPPAPAPIPAPVHGHGHHPAPPPPVEQIAGYRILGPLGRGSMGSVWKAVQVSLQRTVAVKILSPHLAHNPTYARRFEREALASAKLNHPNIIAALDVGEDHGMRYLVMEYVEGRTAAELLAAGPLDEHRAVGIVIQVARALDHAHRSEIVHRDIKPANVIVTREGVAKLCDLGLAKEVAADGSQTDEGMAMGTPFYVSPEQARGERRIDIRSDLYSLGATLFHMVTGRVPFPGPNPAVVMTRHLNDPLEPPDDVNPRVSRGLAQIIEKAMAKEREGRYQTPAEMMQDLQAWMEGRLAVRQPTIDLRSRRRFRRGR